MSKTLKSLFTLSVALNVLLLGAGGGLVIKEWREHHPLQMPQTDDMSPQSQALMKERFDKMREDMQPLFAEVQKSRDHMKAILAEENFDSTRFDEAVSRIRDLRLRMSDQMSAAAKEVIAGMPPDERRKMADRLVHGLSWQQHGQGGQWHCTREVFGPQKSVSAH